MMEEYYTLNGAWLSPSQKYVAQGANRVLDPASTRWSNVPAASGGDIGSNVISE